MTTQVKTAYDLKIRCPKELNARFKEHTKRFGNKGGKLRELIDECSRNTEAIGKYINAAALAQDGIEDKDRVMVGFQLSEQSEKQLNTLAQRTFIDKTALTINLMKGYLALQQEDPELTS